jgi:hypothetical protein
MSRVMVNGARRDKAVCRAVLIPIALVLATALVALVFPLLSVHATTVQSACPYCDANLDENITVLDLGQTRAIITGSQPETSAADCSMDGHITVLDQGQVRAVITGSQTAGDRYIAGYDFSSGGHLPQRVGVDRLRRRRLQRC